MICNLGDPMSLRHSVMIAHKDFGPYTVSSIVVAYSQFILNCTRVYTIHNSAVIVYGKKAHFFRQSDLYVVALLWKFISVSTL